MAVLCPSLATRTPRFPAKSSWALLGLVLACACGCGTSDSADQTDPNLQTTAEETAEKSALEIGPLYYLMARAPQESTAPKLAVKPGHWMPTAQRMRVNDDNFVGTSSTTLIDEQMEPVRLDNTHFTFEVTRPVVLAKEREKIIAGTVYVPAQDSATRLRSRLLLGSTRSIVHLADLPVTRMPSYQYYLVVVAKEASRYAYWKAADSVRAEWEEEFEDPRQPHYRVVLADTKEGVNLPSSLFSWSSVAVMVWDEVDATQLSSAQQQALVDWLHWGGRLVISGPDSLDGLRGSFLDAYLPADSAGQREFTGDELGQWSAFWNARTSGKPLPALAPRRPLSGVKLAPRDGARELAGGKGLVYERNVGQGVVLVSAVRLDERELINWPGFDSFLNAGLLGRPRREFTAGPYGGLRVDWADYRDRSFDAHFVTGLRLFARDAAAGANYVNLRKTSVDQFGSEQVELVSQVDRAGGVAAWSDHGPVASAARNLLTEAAGVSMPGPSFILACLAAYLVVLVPLNWMVFHTLGRVEWAWFAAPLIAVAGTYGVVRLAQLDIGFVRSQTEIAVMEVQGELPRALLTTYTALYSSLSTTYEFKFDEPDAVATPFAAGSERSTAIDSRVFAVSLDLHADAVLRGLVVPSNSTRMVHSEQMIPLAGALKLGTSSRNNPQVENNTGLNLREVTVVRRHFTKSGQPQYDASWIGDLRHGTSVALGLVPYSWSAKELPYAEERTRAARVSAGQRMDIDEMLALAFQFPNDEDPRNGRRDEMRLVGRVDSVALGFEISPAASQSRGTTVILAHLQLGGPPPAQPDVNSRADLDLTPPDYFDAELPRDD